MAPQQPSRPAPLPAQELDARKWLKILDFAKDLWASDYRPFLEAEDAAAQAASDLANAGTSPSAMKYAARRLGMKVYTEQRLHYVKKLKEMGIGVRAGGGAGAGSAAGAGAGAGAGGAETEG